MEHRRWIGLSLLFLAVAVHASGASIAPSDLLATDTANDAGDSIVLEWSLSAEASEATYQIMRRQLPDGEFEALAAEGLPAGTSSYQDASVERGVLYEYKLQASGTDGAVTDSNTSQAQATGEWFHTGKTNMFLALLAFAIIVVVAIQWARSGREIFVRPIAGLEAVDEAIGRATEMGRSILYVLGIGGVSSVATIAGMNILGHVARRTAEYETPLRVPCADPIVMNVSREIAKTAYMDTGRPDAYHEEDIFFVTEAQFAYAAAVDGMMVREKPAAIFLQGVFYAESLILAETGNQVGAIQIAGTDRDTQLPFFITACDYTLIGEELFAASAYLSRDPMLLGTLKGQDIGKLVLLVSLILGAVLELAGVHWFTTFFAAP